MRQPWSDYVIETDLPSKPIVGANGRDPMKTLPTVLGQPKNYLAALPFLIRTDSYKAGHALMYPPDTTEMVAYSEYRKPLSADDHRIVQWGARYKLETLLNRRITWQDIEEADGY